VSSFLTAQSSHSVPTDFSSVQFSSVQFRCLVHNTPWRGRA